MHLVKLLLLELGKKFKWNIFVIYLKQNFFMTRAIDYLMLFYSILICP